MYKVIKGDQDSRFKFEPTFIFEKDGVKYRLWYKPRNNKTASGVWETEYQEFLRFDDREKTNSVATGDWVEDFLADVEIDEKYFVGLEVANLKWLPLGNDCLDFSLQEKNNPDLDITLKKEKNIQDAMQNLYGKILYDITAGYVTAYFSFYAGQFWISECKKYARYGNDMPQLQGVSSDYLVKL